MPREYKKCPTCSNWHYQKEACLPKYKVYHEEYMGEDFKEFHANSHQDAALEYGEYYNSDGDYALMNSEIQVKVEKDGIIKFFSISAEQDIHYSSTEIDRLEEVTD